MWRAALTDTGVGIDLSQTAYQVLDVTSGVVVLPWRTLSNGTQVTGGRDYSVPIYRNGVTWASIPSLGSDEHRFEISIRGRDLVGRTVTMSRCWNQKLLAAPVFVGPPSAGGATSGNYTVDTKAPTLAITDNDAGVANGPVTFTFTFSEAVTGFTADDVAVTNGTKGTFTSNADGSVYTLVVTPTGGEIAVSVPVGAAQDAAGNASTAANATQAVDIGAPTVTSITMADTALNIGETSLVTITFSEAVTGFDNADVTVENYLKLWCRIKQGRASYLRHEGAGILEELEVTPLLRKLGRELSKGQRRRVQIAAGFLISPKLFLFDEPFDGLDVSQSNRLSLILERKSREMSMIISSHRMEVVERLADHVIVLEKGSVLASGSVDEVCTELCGQSILISNLGALVGQFLPELRAAFKQSVIQSVGEQISVIGRDITLEHLHAFFNEHHGGNPLLRIARPTLDDAMRYHLER